MLERLRTAEYTVCTHANIIHPTTINSIHTIFTSSTLYSCFMFIGQCEVAPWWLFLHCRLTLESNSFDSNLTNCIYASLEKDFGSWESTFIKELMLSMIEKVTFGDVLGSFWASINVNSDFNSKKRTFFYFETSKHRVFYRYRKIISRIYHGTTI